MSQGAVSLDDIAEQPASNALMRVDVMESQVMCMSRDQSGDQTPEDRNMPSGNVMRYHDTPRPGVNTINSLSINSTELSAPSH